MVIYFADFLSLASWEGSLGQSSRWGPARSFTTGRMLFKFALAEALILDDSPEELWIGVGEWWRGLQLTCV